MMFWYGNGMNEWGYVLMTVSMVLFWGLVILGIVVMIRYLAQASQRRGKAGTPRLTPERLLAERFARGEIDEPEYRTRLATLQGSGTADGS
ncbi:SHOCT domain-containing protein [Amycolatopsis mongoliensis]|uniref:SHOCT domain-containing protein n=1 Tax=Amycolatopsis mongoliensis TaxID=715475 RepID=A0A9Y2JGH9_9PSEU|nr:SHOCT domain-containing protein [Amycolatopsis sp. 4-36]WIX98032.1 SHOCT domain-containing protein [Amycolatopsis sp. 4-36]